MESKKAKEIALHHEKHEHNKESYKETHKKQKGRK